jgi:predicted ATPase
VYYLARSILTGDPGIGKSTLLLQVANTHLLLIIMFFIFHRGIIRTFNGEEHYDWCYSKNLLFSDEACLNNRNNRIGLRKTIFYR